MGGRRDSDLRCAGADSEAFLAAGRWCSDHLSLTEQRILSAYVWYLLRAAATLHVGHRPTNDELRELAESAQAQVAVHLRIGSSDIWRTLMSAFDTVPLGQEVKGGDFVAFGTATIGALLRNDRQQLEVLRTSLARWCQLHSDEMRDVVGDE
jgi:hypothetical protein